MGVINSALSPWTQVTSGVPQGAVLGLLLFTKFFTNILSTVNILCSLLADDTKIHAALDDKHILCTTSLQDHVRLQNWTVDMQMWLHPAKCRTRHLGKNNPNTKYTLPIDDGTLHEKIAQTAEEKANSAVELIRHTFKYLNKESFLYLYKSLIRPHLEYAIVKWSPKIKKHEDNIEKVQRRAARLLPETSQLSYNDRLLTLGLPTLKYR